MRFDCIVVGSGHAGSCAALSAVENGCKEVLIVDKCPPEWVGGNGYFTAGAHRTVHGGLQDLLPIVKNVTPEQADKIDMEPYTADEFKSDIMRLGGGQSDGPLVDAVVNGSRDAIGWLASHVGIPFIFSFHRQAYEVDGRQKFWGGLALSVEDGGKGLIAAHQKALKKAGVRVWFNTPAIRLIVEEKIVKGLVVRKDGVDTLFECDAVVLAAGGYESSSQLRAQHLGEEWQRAKVRGTPYNTGDGFLIARGVGAKLTGDWSGCHSTCWDAGAPSDAGERTLTNQYTKSGYPLGLMINVKGNRFVDEGEDFRNYTYAKFGRAILQQPEGVAFQIWDSKVIGTLRKEEYGDGVTEKILADTLEGLADKLAEKGLESKAQLLDTVTKFNEAVNLHRAEHPGLRFDPAIKDGMSTMSLAPPKSNWALPLDRAPFMAVKVTCGITFTFGGLAIDPATAGVVSDSCSQTIEGLYCTGEMVGGLFHTNYPGGSGLTAGAVFGRKAGLGAAKRGGTRS
ncbi:fumarate reductase flavoprotein subunit [Moniliophthora roreri MCA 2997]|uniref:Fumarate reductase flavoprotein subunit n=1 Tax=Moniliophthora roreri (strain MCA 2997) TaxID=1381753 RepID=V2X8V6_MONRO|nr:fumarate reductase flavoprotein subunit [Moniliophthora roreri MCA 2997]